MGKKRVDMKATDMARKIWRTVGYCENVKDCKSKKKDPQLHGAHLFGVGAYPQLKADLRNGLSLCSACHRFYTSAPADFIDFIKSSKYQKYIQPLRDKNNGPKTKIFWDERLEFLTDIHKQIQAGEMTLEEARKYES